jgi:hypothetical protein
LAEVSHQDERDTADISDSEKFHRISAPQIDTKRWKKKDGKHHCEFMVKSKDGLSRKKCGTVCSLPGELK